MKHYLYKTTNTVNGKEYVGIHSTKNVDDGYLGSGLAIKQAIKKYGRSAFKKEIIAFFKDRESLLKGESALVDEYYISRDDTYNMAIGGSGGPSCVIPNEETRRKLSIVAKTRVRSAETRAKLSAAALGNKRASGKKNTPEQKEATRIRSVGNTWAKGLRYTFPSVTCPHCGKVGSGGAMSRYHFENCKANRGIQCKK